MNTFPVFFVTDAPVGLECSSCPQQISSLEFLLPFACPVATRQPTNCRPKPFTFHYCSIPGMLQPIMREAGDDVAHRHQDETISGHGYALATTWMGVGLQITYNLEGFSHYLVNTTSNPSGGFLGSRALQMYPWARYQTLQLTRPCDQLVTCRGGAAGIDSSTLPLTPYGENHQEIAPTLI